MIITLSINVRLKVDEIESRCIHLRHVTMYNIEMYVTKMWSMVMCRCYVSCSCFIVIPSIYSNINKKNREKTFSTALLFILFGTWEISLYFREKLSACMIVQCYFCWSLLLLLFIVAIDVATAAAAAISSVLWLSSKKTCSHFRYIFTIFFAYTNTHTCIRILSIDRSHVTLMSSIQFQSFVSFCFCLFVCSP